MATDYANLTLEARAEARDLVYSNPVTRETPDGVINGANLLFYLQNKNLVSGLVGSVQYGPWLTYGTTLRSLATGAYGFTLDALNGLITLTGAAPVSTTKPFAIDYFFQWFQDADYAFWIDQATLELAQPAGSFSPAVDGGGSLTPALIQYVVERFWLNRASQYASKYASAAAGASEQVQTVTANYSILAKQARAKGDKLRVAAYVNPGAKSKPASGTITYGMTPASPPR